MGRQKKIKTVQIDEKKDSEMSTPEVLESTLTEVDLARIELSNLQKEIEEKKQEVKKLREITPEEQKIVDKQIQGFKERDSLNEKLERQKAYDSEMITGRFMNRRAPGNPAKLTYQKYAHDPVKWTVFEDGKVYTIPRGFAEQINEYYHTPKFIQKQGEMDPNKPASAIHEIDRSNKKYAFVPVNF